jgi:hypothetical protein
MTSISSADVDAHRSADDDNAAALRLEVAELRDQITQLARLISAVGAALTTATWQPPAE